MVSSLPLTSTQRRIHFFQSEVNIKGTLKQFRMTRYSFETTLEWIFSLHAEMKGGHGGSAVTVLKLLTQKNVGLILAMVVKF